MPELFPAPTPVYMMYTIMVAGLVVSPAAAGQRGVEDFRADVRALVAEWSAAGRFVPRCDAWLRSADLEFSRALAEHGLIGMTWPAPYGLAAGYVARLAVTEELLRAGAPVAAHWIADRQIGPSVLRHGTPDLQAEILPPITRAEATFCLGMSEPDAGSDLAAVRTRAVACDGGYRVSGRKVWTSGAHVATHIYVLARTTPLDRVGRRHQGLSEFVVDLGSPGIEVTPIIDMAGQHHFNEVTFEEVLVPSHRLLGIEGAGWAQVMEQLAFERGGPERFLSTYPLLRRAMAAPAVAENPALVARLGELVARLAVLRRLGWEIAGAMDSGLAPVQQAATCKLLGNSFEVDIIEFARAAVAAGAEELRADAEGALLASPGFGIRGGAADVLLSLITRQELGS